MGRKRKTRWRRLSIGETSANEDEDGELGGAVISLTRSHSHSASQNHSPARHLSSDKSLIAMTNNNKDSSSSPSLHNSSSNLTTPNGGGGSNNGNGGPNSGSSTNAKILPGTSSSSSPLNPDKSGLPPQNSSPSSATSPNHHSHHHSQSSGYHHNGHNHVPHQYNNSTHPSPNSVSSNESTSSSTGGGGGGNGGGGHYNDRYHYTRENYRPPHHHHHHHHNHHHSSHHNSNYNGGSSSASHYQGGSGEGGSASTSRGERGSSYHYSGHPHKEYQNGYHGTSHYSGYQGSTYYRNSHNNYRNSHYNSGGGGGGGGGSGGGGEPYGESEGYNYPPSSRPYGGRFRKSRSYPASSYYYPGSSKSSGGAGNNTDNINRPSYNQDEYTKITTPRQDVLFKKGYLSQKKTQPSSSVDSTSAATTPSASTNGTPDTQSTNGINSDNSEGYENGETDYVIPYDDTIYYAPPPEAVFTDPNTGQVYYGHCSSTGEYYDAYPVSPVMVAAGYPPVYYPMMPYAPLDAWNGVPAPMYPVVAAPVPPHPLPAVDDPSLLSPGLQLTDEGSSSSVTTTTTAVESCANLATTAAAVLEHEENALPIFTTTNNTQAADFTESAVVINENKLKEGTMRESGELTRTIEDGKEKTKEKSVEEMGESYYAERNTTITTGTAGTTTSTTSVTSSEAATKQNCDSKLENIIASKEFSIFDKTAASAEAAVTSVPISYSTRKKGDENEEITAAAVVAAASSLTLESPDKMNEEIEIRPLKQEMSKTEGEAQKVCGMVGLANACSKSKSLSASSLEKKCEQAPGHEKQQRQEKSDEVTTTAHRGNSKSHENVDDNPVETTAVAFSGPSSQSSATFPASPSSSCPSSTNESTTSSPVNEGTSLMRSQSKLASQKNLAREDEPDNSMTAQRLENAVGESCKGKNNNNKDNFRKKNKRKQSPPLNLKTGNTASGVGGNKKNNRMRERKDDDSINLLGNMEQNGKTKNKHGQMDNGEENNKTVPSSDETRGQQEGQSENGNQMTSSSDSSQPQLIPQQESCSSPKEVEAETGGICDSLIDSCTTGLMTSQPSSTITSSSSSASRKPTDLTVQCPTTSGNDELGQYEALQLQRSPSLQNEPSSPDSLNTNQSVAGSEFAPGENLSVSESDLMNRTTSIDEVEEDLPQEAEFIVETEASTGFTVPNSNSSNDDSENPATKSLSEGKLEISEVSAKTTTPAACVDEEFIKSTAATLRATVATPSSCSALSEKSTNEEREAGGGETTSRPQSITLAVTEWLKTQGEGALTPVIARTSSSDEGDVEEETTTDSGEDSGEEDYEGENGKRDDKASNLEQNQKNVHGNPWAIAPSNKSGSTTKVSKSNGTPQPRCRRSGSKKSITVKVENEGSWSATAAGLPKSDGVCSRVAPILSSKASSPKFHDETSPSNKNSNNSGTSDDDASSSPAHMAKNIISKNNEPSENANDDNHKTSFSKSPNFSKLSNNYLKNIRNDNDSSSKADDDSCTISIVEMAKDYDSGLELSSTENSSSMSSIKCTPMSANNNKNSCTSTESNGKSINATSAATVMNAKNKSKDLADSPLSCVTTTATIDTTPTDIAAASVNESCSKKSSEKPPLPKLITNSNNQTTTTHHYHATHNGYFNPNPDQIVIAAPLSIVQQDSAISSTQKTGNNSDNDEVESSHPSRNARKHSTDSVSTAPPPQAFHSATVSSSSSCNHTAPTSPLGMTGSGSSIMLFSRSSSINNNDVQSPSSMPSSLTSIMDEQRDHTEICDPQRYAKYYQFGVVFDTSDDPDQGIDTAADEGDSTDSLEEIALDSPEAVIIRSTATTTTAAAISLGNMENDKNNDNITHPQRQQKNDEPQQKRSTASAGETEHQEQQKNTNDFLAVMMERNRKLARSGKKSAVEKKKKRVDKERNNGDDVLVSKSVYLQDEDEEIGTFDPKVVEESRRLRRASYGGGGGARNTAPGEVYKDDDKSTCLDYYTGETAMVADAPSSPTMGTSQPASSSPHLYINPLSLAAELSGSEMVKVGPKITNNKKKAAAVVEGDKSNSFDSESSDEPPLPPYESPPSVEIPVYNATTPAARVIRQNFYAIGDPVSGAICCSIM